VILIVKLGYYYTALPKEIDMITNHEVTELYPEDEDSKHLCYLNLLEQISQIFPYEMKQAHIEFVKFCFFLDKCAMSI